MKAAALLSLPWPLTAREVEVMLHWRAHGRLKAVAREMQITPETVDWHVRRVRRKLGEPNNTRALVAFVEALPKGIRP